MLVDEVDASGMQLTRCLAGKFGLTNSATDLLYKSNADGDSHGNYDYQAHAHVYAGGADPLESQGCTSEVRPPSSS